jgi:hypothetical protein
VLAGQLTISLLYFIWGSGAVNTKCFVVIHV